MGEAVEASADVELGEAFKPAAAAHARIYRGELKGTALLALLFIGGIVLGTAAGMAVSARYPQWGSWPTSILSIAGMTAGLVLGLRAYSRQHVGGFLAALRKMGSPARFPTRFRFTDEAIETVNERVSHRISWDAVLFVAPGPDHWLVQADTLTLAIPRRAFADPAAEQAFLDFAQARLSNAARSRSVFKSHSQ
jgi:hypothetical protein